MTPNFIIVDDDAINNMMCKMAIARHFGPVAIHSYQNPEEALEMIPGFKAPTVLFLDLKMPQIQGWDFLDRMAGFSPETLANLTTFILSSSGESGDIARAAAHPGVSGFIKKPLTGKKLAKVLVALPANYGLRCFE